MLNLVFTLGYMYRQRYPFWKKLSDLRKRKEVTSSLQFSQIGAFMGVPEIVLP